jgi:23S rRNA (adenine2503-C2)-methyltransferase
LKKFSEFSTLPIPIRNNLDSNFQIITLKEVKHLISQNRDTHKVLFKTMDGNPIETVLMSYHNRHTLCISTQSGCGMGCTFCATGQMGFRGNLTTGEIIEQVLFFARFLNSYDSKLTNIVLMGMGEPLLNYDSSLNALDILNDTNGFQFSQRRFSISTVGIIPMIDRLSEEHRQFNLAVSLHAADNELRSKLLPINNKYPLDKLIDACRNYVSKTNRRISFEWALINKLNDSSLQAELFTKITRGLLCHVNIILLNPTEGFPGKESSYKNAIHFKSILNNSGIPCTIRVKRGLDIQAGCGQLASKTSLE